MSTDLPARLIKRLRAQLANLADVPDSYVPLMLSRADAENLLRILEFVESARIETMK
jgi:hypothetical protein